MSLRTHAFNILPTALQPLVKRSYRTIHPDETPEHRLRRWRKRYIEEHFDSREEYDGYIDELNREPVRGFLKEARKRVRNERGTSELGNKYFHDVYAYVRKQAPETVVETGVRDGWSTIYILSAFHLNEAGRLYSIDYPIRADEEAEGFGEEAPSYRETTPTIPAGTDPGWIVPEELTNRWELLIGKSQERMPELVTRVDEIDVFIHDSDHSMPCMIFEYELAWDWLGSSGIIFSDDIDWNDAFERFADVKHTDAVRLSTGFGYIVKGDGENLPIDEAGGGPESVRKS